MLLKAYLVCLKRKKKKKKENKRTGGRTFWISPLDFFRSHFFSLPPHPPSLPPCYILRVIDLKMFSFVESVECRPRFNLLIWYWSKRIRLPTFHWGDEVECKKVITAIKCNINRVWKWQRFSQLRVSNFKERNQNLRFILVLRWIFLNIKFKKKKNV